MAKREYVEAKLITTRLVFHFFLDVTFFKDSNQLSIAKNASFKSNGFNKVLSTELIGTRTKDSSTVPLSFLVVCATYISSMPI